MDGSNLALIVARRLREVRDSKGYTQARVAELAKMPAADVSRYENSHRVPSLATLERLASALDVPAWQLLLPDGMASGPFDALVANEPPAVRRQAAAVIDALLRNRP